MSSKTKNYLQTQLFPDEDIKQPKHDDIMFWLDKNINAITEEILPKDISKYINKYEKEKLQKLLQEQLLKDETFKADIHERIQTTENINDVIAYINKGYRLGLMLSKEITDQLK